MLHLISLPMCTGVKLLPQFHFCFFFVSLQSLFKTETCKFHTCYWHFCVVTGVIYKARTFKREKAMVKCLNEVFGDLLHPSLLVMCNVCRRSGMFPYSCGNENIQVRYAELGACKGDLRNSALAELPLIHSSKRNRDFRHNDWGSHLWKLCSQLYSLFFGGGCHSAQYVLTCSSLHVCGTILKYKPGFGHLNP